MDTNTYNQLKPLILTIRKHLNQTRRTWWSLGILKSSVKNYNEIEHILHNLEAQQPSSVSAFKYVISVLYSAYALKNTKAIRESILEYISNYQIKSHYDRDDIARYLSLQAPRTKPVWWSFGLFNVPALIAHEESILQRFRNNKKIKSQKENTNKDTQSKNIDNKCYTDTKILKIADDINSLSQTIYTELPKIDQKIKTEIKRISDDLKGLSNLIDMLDTEVPFNVQSIKKEICDILGSFNKVVAESSYILQDKVNKVDSEKTLFHNNSQKNDEEIVQNETNNIKNEVKPKENIENYTELKPKKEKEKEKNNTKENYLVTPIIKKQKAKKTIFADDIKWLDKIPVEQKLNYNKPTGTRSYINKELTAQLHTEKVLKSRFKNYQHFNHANKFNKQINPDKIFHEDDNHHSADLIHKIDDQFVNMINDTQHKDGTYINNCNQIEKNTPLNQAVDTSSNNSNDSNDSNDSYYITFADPCSNDHTKDLNISLNINNRVLKINTQYFDISTRDGLQKFESYLDNSTDNTLSIALSDIIMKFMYDTNLSLEQLEECGLTLCESF